jgi:hypothetical protein
MKITTISNIDCLLTEREVMQILKIADYRTFRGLGVQKVILSKRIVRFEPEAVRAFIQNKKK